MINKKHKYCFIPLFLISVISFFLLSCGDQGDSVTGDGTSDTLMTWNGDVNPILQSKCSSCHSSTSTNGFDISDTYSVLNAFSSRGNRYVVPLYPDSSEIYWRINGTNGLNQMPPGTPLSENNRQTIEKWISQGAHL